MTPTLPRVASAPQAITLIALGTLPTMAIAALVAVLPLFFEHFHDVAHRELLVPMVLTIPALGVALCSAPLGWLADRWGRRPVLLGSLIAYTVFGALPVFFDSLGAIIASRAIVGIGEAGVLAVGNALMGDYFRDEVRRYWLGIQMSVGPVFASGYILLGGALASVWWRAPFLIYLLGAVVLAAAWIFLDEPARTGYAAPSDSNDTPDGFPWRTTVIVSVTTILVSIVYFLQAVQHGRIFSELGVATPSKVSVVVTIASLGTIVGGWWFKARRPRPVPVMLAIAIGAYGLAYVGVAARPVVWLGVLLDSLGQFGGGYALPTLIAWALSKYAFRYRGRGMGIWGACFFLGQFLSPPVMTAIAAGRFSFLDSVGVLGVVCLIAAAALAWRGRNAPVLDTGR